MGGQTGAIPITGALSGSERVVADNGGATITTVTTQQIANLAGGAGTDKQTNNTPIVTVGNGTLTAAAIAGGLITRSGSVAAYTDTTATAAQIVAAIPNAFVGQAFTLRIKNTVPFAETIAAGTGVTISGGNTVIPPNSLGTWLMTLTNITAAGAAVTMLSTDAGPLSTGTIESITALTTVGAGTITAASIVNGVTARSGPTAAFTDTTDTAAAIIAAQNNAMVGQSWEWTYQNNVPFTATFTGGVGITLTGIAAVPGLTTLRALVTYTAAGAVTIALISTMRNVALPAAQWAQATLSLTTVQATLISGADNVSLNLGDPNPSGINFPTAPQLIAAIPNVQVGFSYLLNIRNQGAGTATITTNTGVTLNGTMTIAQNVTRTFVVTIATATTVTVNSMGISAAGA